MGDELISLDEFARATSFDKPMLRGIARALMSVLKIERINQLYSKNKDRPALEFIDAVLQELDLNVQIEAEELKRIPAEGPCVVVCNHPLGGIDGLILLKALLQVRSDIRVMANFLLTKIEPINSLFLPVNPFENHKDAKSSLAGIREAANHLKSGGLVGVFPAGEVSTYQLKSRRITDKKWNPGIVRFIRKQQVPVVPIFFDGGNSVLFHVLGMVNPMLRTVRLPSELFNKRDKTVHMRIGRSIAVSEQDNFEDVAEYGRFLRAKVYLLGTKLEVKRFYSPFKKLLRREEPIVQPLPQQAVQSEIEKLFDSDYLLFQTPQAAVFCPPADRIPTVLNELGRLRELTFRGVGEGTGRSLDLDEFDLYYRHLILWDKSEQKIMGAYRMGIGHEIMARFGKRGFYINTLFRIASEFLPLLNQTLELGRSFLVPEYQQKPMPLFLLWKGILYFLLKNPECRFLIGPVTISGEFSSLSKYLITEFIKKNHFDHGLAQYIKPRKKFKPKIDPTALDLEILERSTLHDMKRLDKLIEEIESGHFRLPALLKKYLSTNAKILAFNIDPAFNNALDGLVILDLFDVPEQTIKSLSKELEENISGKFANSTGDLNNSTKEV